MRLNNILKLTLIVLIVTLQACTKEEKKPEKKEKVKVVDVKVHTLKKQAYPIWVNFSGKTEAYKNVTITSRVSGELKKRYFNAGDIVKKNQLLFKIDDTQYKSILAQKEATLQKDIASLNLAIANVNRYEPLVKKGLAPREKLDELIAQQKQLKAVVDADKASIKQAKIDVEYTNIKATINGQIGKSLVDIGNIIQASSTNLAKIVDSKKLYVNFNPSNQEVTLIKKYKSQKNPKVEILQESKELNPTKTYGFIDFIDNVTNETTGTVLMRAKVENENNLILPGTFVKIRLFVTDKIPVIAIDPNLISQNQLGSYVLVVNKDNKIETKQIKINYSNEELVIIKEGLKQGDKIVISNSVKLLNDTLVNPIEVANPIKK